MFDQATGSLARSRKSSFLRRAWMVWLVPALIFAVGPARAIIVIGPIDPNTGKPMGGYNSTPPGGDPVLSGWQFEGGWQNAFTGTAIAPNYFITAAHLGGSVGDTFNYEGQAFTTTARFLDPIGSDLVIWKVSGTFASYARLYNTPDEAGQMMQMFGRGGPPGPSTANGVPINGFQWTNPSGGLSWGNNTIVGAGPIKDAPPGQYLLYRFDQTLGPNTGTLTAGDSGGGVFILKNGAWQLAGVNFATDGPYNTLPASDPNSSRTSFNASLYDSRGLYFNGDNTPISGPNPVPSDSIATRISNEFGWIASVIGVPEPGGLLLTLIGLALAVPLFRRGGRRVAVR